MTEEPRPKITAVIPAFNEEKTILDVVKNSQNYVSEVLVIDDGSEDATSRRAIEAGATVIRIPNNSGKGNALAIGLTTAALNGSEIVVCLDADGQHDPADIPKLVRPITEGRADMVIGSRFLDVNTKNTIPAYRRLGQGVLTVVTNVGNHIKITDSQSGFRAFRKEALDAFEYTSSGMGIESEMIRRAVKGGLRIEEVPIVAMYTGLDTSTFAPASHGMSVIGSILKEIRSDHPLLYFGVSGTVMTIVGVAFGLYSVNYYLDTSALPYGPSLLAVTLTTLGILFVLVGLILNAISEMVANGRKRKMNNH